jgi:hypocretin (orexin) receptor 2
MIGLIWLISGIILLPDVVVLDTFRRFPPELQTDLLTTCKPAWEYHHQMAFQLFLIVALYVVPFVIMGAAYTSIAICLWSTVIPSESVTANSDFQPSVYSRHSDSTSHLPRIKDAHYQMLSRRKVAKMLIAVVVMFGVCYLPVHLLNILRYAQVGMKDDTGVVFALIAHWLCYFNSAINPVIYNFMSEKFQRAFSDVLHCRCHASRHSNSYGATALSTAHYIDTRMATWKRSQQLHNNQNAQPPPCPV